MTYATPTALRIALEQRLLNQSNDTGIGLDRLRRRVIFERVVSRLEVADPGRWVLKGGMAHRLHPHLRHARRRHLTCPPHLRSRGPLQIRAAPHGPSDVSPITLAASLHVDLATPNFGIQEFMGYEPLVDEVFEHSYSYADGYLHPGEAPGLGVDFNEQLAARYPYNPAYLPVARRRDGTMTDW